MSIAQFILLGNWLVATLIQRQFKSRIKLFYDNKIAFFMALLFVVYIIGIFYSKNVSHAFHEAKIKLPLLTLPWVFSTSRNFFTKGLHKGILFAFAGTVVVVSLINIGLYYGQEVQTDIRTMSRFISHIRFSLCIVFALLILLKNIRLSSKLSLFIKLTSFFWLITYLIISQSITGIVLAVILLPFFLYVEQIRKKASPLIKLGILLILLIPTTWIASLFFRETAFYTNKEELNNTYELLDTTQHGYPYEHKLYNHQIENGYYIWRNVCYAELQYAWNNVSETDFWKKDKSGEYQYASLIRYMASKGLIKDAEGFKELSNEDIEAIENGVTNYRFKTMNGVHRRVYETLWEIDYYRHGALPAYGSLIQRLAFWKAAYKTWQQDPLIGVGSGDLKEAMEKWYQTSSLKGHPSFWLKPHNQYLTFLVQFGIVGFIVCLCSVFIPFCIRPHSTLYLFFIALIGLSMFTEDTLDTQAGITFFAFFHAYFGFYKDKFV